MMYSKAFLAVAVVATLSAPVAADPPTGADTKAELAKLQGIWKVAGLTDEMGPAPVKELEQWTFAFHGDQVTIRQTKDAGGHKATFTLDPSKTPKEINLNEVGLVTEGIYKLDGDNLTLCVVTGSRNEKTAARPKEFTADKAHKYSVFVLKRVKT
jgi:uncharacterized protein (TIGR03067 family)